MLYKNITLATMTEEPSYGLLEKAAMVIDDQYIVWIGPLTDLPKKFHCHEAYDCEGRLVTPGLIDCHTHIVYGGNRAREFEQRLNGASYEEIAKAGGGILSTVRDTRALSEDALLQQSLVRVDGLIQEGVTTLEIKSGYGLECETELKMLRVAEKISHKRPLNIQKTYLAAHALPPDYQGRSEDYITEMVVPCLHKAHEQGLVDAVDGFCETIGFTPAQIETVFRAAQDLGLPVKLHSEQLSAMGGAALAARFKAMSVEHLEYLTQADIEKLAQAKSVAVLLPGAFYALGETQAPPIEGLRKAQIPMALATDCNPGSSPMNSLLLAMNMGCVLFGLTPEEALAGVTRHAARALGLSDRGQIKVGLRADLALWNVDHPAELAYRFGFNPLHRRIFGGAS